jgi:hypothetical protein
MIHLIVEMKRDVEVEVEDETVLGHWRHLPSKGEHEADDSRVGCVEGRVHVDQGRVEKHGSEAGGSRRRWHANSWIGTASGSP